MQTGMYFVTRQHSLRVCHHVVHLFIYITQSILAFHWILSKGALSKSVCVLWICLLPGALQLLNLLKFIVYFNLVCLDKKEGKRFRLGYRPSYGGWGKGCWFCTFNPTHWEGGQAEKQKLGKLQVFPGLHIKRLDLNRSMIEKTPSLLIKVIVKVPPL